MDWIYLILAVIFCCFDCNKLKSLEGGPKKVREFDAPDHLLNEAKEIYG